VALLALDATVLLRGPAGDRRVPLDGFYLLRGRRGNGKRCSGTARRSSPSSCRRRGSP
jgi:CO/xanthine dehydrogenase FAD-binding subunit